MERGFTAQQPMPLRARGVEWERTACQVPVHAQTAFQGRTALQQNPARAIPVIRIHTQALSARRPVNIVLSEHMPRQLTSQLATPVLPLPLRTFPAKLAF